MNWVDVKTKMPSDGSTVLGWDTVRNAPRVVTLREGAWITESRLEIPCVSEQISHWTAVERPINVA